MYQISWALLTMIKLALLFTALFSPFIIAFIYHWVAKERLRLRCLENSTGWDLSAYEAISARMFAIVFLGYLVMVFGVLVYIAPQG